MVELGFVGSGVNKNCNPKSGTLVCKKWHTGGMVWELSGVIDQFRGFNWRGFCCQ